MNRWVFCLIFAGGLFFAFWTGGALGLTLACPKDAQRYIDRSFKPLNMPPLVTPSRALYVQQTY